MIIIIKMILLCHIFLIKFLATFFVNLYPMEFVNLYISEPVPKTSRRKAAERSRSDDHLEEMPQKPRRVSESEDEDDFTVVIGMFLHCSVKAAQN